MRRKLSVRKYMGDDSGSWAVFNSVDLKGLPRGPVVDWAIKPLVAGCERREADHYKRQLEGAE